MILLSFIYFSKIILSQQIDYQLFTFDDAVNAINDVPYNKTDYDNIITYLKQVFIDYYAYLDIAKNPPLPYQPVDLIKEFQSINTENITLYDFYKIVHSSMLLLKDQHVQISFGKIQEFNYICPFQYITVTEGNTNYLMLVYNEKIFELFYQKGSSLEDEIKAYLQDPTPIKDINGQNPFDFIQNFGKYQIFKSEHAHFSYNINQGVITGSLNSYPFEKTNLTNITIYFLNGLKITFDYQIFKIKSMSTELSEFYNKEMKKYQNSIIHPTIFDIEKKFLEEKKKIRKRNLQQSFWDLDYEGKIKLKIDKNNEVNVIYQNTFSFEEEIDGENIFDEKSIDFFLLMAKKLNNNNYPIIVIEDFNPGGYVVFSSILECVLNYNLSLNNYNFAEKFKKGIDYKNTELIDYGNNITHNRTKIQVYDLSYALFNGYFKNLKSKIRKPTEIIVFTDSFSFSTTSFFIKNLQETGNAIIVGYNGNPSEEKKNDKFDSSQSPSSVVAYNDSNIINLKKYDIIVNGITTQETFNDSYINKTGNPIPREYLINPIDERSQIYGKYNDNRYEEFIKEGKRIFKKYQTECNNDNPNLVLLNDSCKFDDKNLIGGFTCVNGKWSNECKISGCLKPYSFNTYTRKCDENALSYYLKQTNNNKNNTNDNNTTQNSSQVNMILVIVIICLSIGLSVMIILFFIKSKSNESVDKSIIELNSGMVPSETNK